MARIAFTERQAREWLGCGLMLRNVVKYALEVWPVDFMYCTSIFRTRDEEERAGGKSGVHCTPDNASHRAFDLRVWNLAEPDISMQERADEIAEKINARFQYDPKRPEFKVALSKPHGGSAPHIHLQVHARTERI